MRPVVFADPGEAAGMQIPARECESPEENRPREAGERPLDSILVIKLTKLTKKTNSNPIYRVLDANLNRLREALRVIEEYYRFIDGRPRVCVALKKARHSLIAIETMLGKETLLLHRDTASDCFAEGNRPEELAREGLDALLSANFRRGQEASRVIEEYAKVAAGGREAADGAKTVRFTLYKLEKDLLSGKRHGTGEKRER
jgi:hypothetical protein